MPVSHILKKLSYLCIVSYRILVSVSVCHRLAETLCLFFQCYFRWQWICVGCLTAISFMFYSCKAWSILQICHNTRIFIHDPRVWWPANNLPRSSITANKIFIVWKGFTVGCLLQILSSGEALHVHDVVRIADSLTFNWLIPKSVHGNGENARNSSEGVEIMDTCNMHYVFNLDTMYISTNPSIFLTFSHLLSAPYL